MSNASNGNAYVPGGTGLPAGGTVGQVVTNTAPGAGDWETVPDLVADPNGTTAILTPAANQIAVSAAIVQSTWAARGAGTFVGQLKLMTDIGNSPGTLMQWDGTFWKILGRCTAYFDTAQANGTASGTQQVLKQFSAPAGLLRCCRYVQFRALFGKSGATDAFTSASLKVGTLGTTSDGQLCAASQANTVRSYGLTSSVFFGTTTVTQLGGVSNTNDGFSATSSTSPPHTNLNTISSIDSNPVFFSATAQLGGTTDTPQAWDMMVELVP